MTYMWGREIAEELEHGPSEIEHAVGFMGRQRLYVKEQREAFRWMDGPIRD